MKHLFRQDLQDYQDFLGLVQQHFVHPVDHVKNGNICLIGKKPYLTG